MASYSGLVASLAQRYEDARACHEHALALGERYGMQFWLSTATAGCAIASGYLGDPRTSIDVLTPALEQWRSLGAGALVPFDLTHRGHLHLEVGELDNALADVDAALALADETTEHFFTAETHRVRATILRASQPEDLAAVRAGIGGGPFPRGGAGSLAVRVARRARLGRPAGNTYRRRRGPRARVARTCAHGRRRSGARTGACRRRRVALTLVSSPWRVGARRSWRSGRRRRARRR